MAKKILVVDDSATVRQQVSMVLKDAGYEVVEAQDGIDGKEKAAANDVAMVISDVNMPRMNGIEMLEEVSKVKPQLPVVMLTTEGHPELLAKAKSFGAKGWIVKPFKPEVLMGAVKKLAGAPV